MIHYMLPDFVLGDKAYTVLCSLQEYSPEVLYPEQAVQFIYGAPPNTLWNGGSLLCSEKFMLMNTIRDLIAYYNDVLKFPIAWTFTNPLLTKEDCYDRYCNLLAEAGHNGMNYILVTSPILEQYLREHYPNYKYCRSIIANEGYNNYANLDYTFLVMERKHNIDFDFLNSIPVEARSRIEILANDFCSPDCPYIYEHYRDFAKSQLAFEALDIAKLQCHYKQMRINNPLVINKQQIDNIYVPLGYTHFKLSGRTSIELIVDNILDYFVKDDYRQLVRGEINGFIARQSGSSVRL